MKAIIAAASCFWLFACASVAPARIDEKQGSEGVVYDGLKISFSDIRQELSMSAGSDPDGIDEQTANDLIQRLILRRKVNHFGDKLLALESRPDIQRALARAREVALYQITLNELRKSIVVPDLTENAKRYYQTNISDFTQPERYRVARIFLRATNETTRSQRYIDAMELLARIRKNPEEFGSLAFSFSDGPYRFANGELELQEVGTADSESEAAIAKLKVEGAISEVVDTPYGFYIYILRERHPKSVIPFETVKAALIKNEERIYLEKQEQLLLSKALPAWDDQINSEFLNEIRQKVADRLDNQEAGPAISDAE